MEFAFKKIEYFTKKPEHGLHSEKHALAKEISEFCGEPKKFGMYLGIIKNIGLQRAYGIFAEMKHAKKIETPGKLFLYLSAYKKPTKKKINPARSLARAKGASPKDLGGTTYKRDGNRKRTGKNTPEKTKKSRKNNA